MLAQILAGLGTNGINLSNLGGLVGKREASEVDPRFLNALNQAINDVFTNVIQKPLEDALSSTEILAFVLVGMKYTLFVLDGALMLAQILAGLGTNGINLSNLGGLVGKREASEVDPRFLNALNQAINDVFANVIQKPLEDALSSTKILPFVLVGLKIPSLC